MKNMTVLCPAKINLTLDVTGNAENGYHEIKSIMQAVSLCDEVSVSVGGSYIKLRSDIPYIPKDRRNIAYKAAEAFFNKTGATYGVSIFIKKRIPVSAGLAGGSTDGAGVIYALNKLFDSPLSNSELIALCKSVGADLPFCFSGGTRLATGIGEKLTSLPSMPDCRFVIIRPTSGLSAADVYKAYDSFPKAPSPDTPAALRALERGDLKALCASMSNVFEPICEKMLPQITAAKNAISAFSPLKVMMSGSGSSVFGVFSNKTEAEKCAAALSENFRYVFTASPIKYGVNEKIRK